MSHLSSLFVLNLRGTVFNLSPLLLYLIRKSDPLGRYKATAGKVRRGKREEVQAARDLVHSLFLFFYSAGKLTELRRN